MKPIGPQIRPIGRSNRYRQTSPRETEKCIVEWCLKLFGRQECRDQCRFDWRLDLEGNPKLLEVKPNTGWFWYGHLAMLIKVSGTYYTEMPESILRLAEQRLNI